MLYSMRETATRLGVTSRQASRAARAGAVVTNHVAGRTIASDRAIVAARRSAGRGRRWSEGTTCAALELLEHGTTERVTGSERSRLKQRLRHADAAELAYQLLGARASLWRSTGGRHVDTELSIADELALSSRGGLAVEVDADAERRARQLRLVRDGDGDVAVVGIDAQFRRVGEALALYAFGGSRESTAAATWLRERASRV